MDNNESRILVFIPSFGDSEALPLLLTAISQLGSRYQALLIDDGSDPPLVIPSSENTLSVRLPATFGLGVCTHIALDHALQKGYRICVRVDADGQHGIEDIPALVEAIEKDGADIAAAVRSNHGEGSGLAWARRFLKGYFSLVARLVTEGKAPSDVNTGFFALDSAAMQLVNKSRLERFPEPEMFISVSRAGLKTSSISVRQRERNKGKTTLSVTAAAQMFFRFNIFVLTEILRRKNR